MHERIEKAIMFLWFNKARVFFFLLFIVVILVFILLNNRISALETTVETKSIEVELHFEWLTTNAQNADLQLFEMIENLRNQINVIQEVIEGLIMEEYQTREL